MRLLTFLKGEEARLGLLVDNRVIDLSASYERLPSRPASLPALPADMCSLLEGGDQALAAAREVEEWARSSGDEVSYSLEEVEIEAPIQNPHKVICVSRMEEIVCLSCGIEPSPLCDLSLLTGFAKFPECLIADGDPIPRPRDWGIEAEGELAMVIGRPGKHIAQELALDHVAGYTSLIDVSTRGHGGHPFLHKCLDASGAMGPFLVSPDEAGNPPALNVTLALNGEVRQSTNTRDLDFDLPYIISSLSHFMTLLPGDIIACGMLGGSSSGRVELNPGDEVTLEIEGLGRISNPVVADPSGERREK